MGSSGTHETTSTGLKAPGDLAAGLVTVAVALATLLMTAVLPASASTAEQTLGHVAIDQGPARRAAALDTCATTSFAANPDSVGVLYGQRQLRTLSRSNPVFVLRNGAGRVLLCDMFGRDVPAVLPLPTPTTSRPAVPLTTGQRRWTCDGTTLRRFAMTTWLRVQNPVTGARVRYWHDGVPGRWFASARHGRIVHLQSWTGGAAVGETVKVETQVLGADGTPLAVPGIPSGPRRLDGCQGDVVIG